MGKGSCDGREGENDPSPEDPGPAARRGRRQSGPRARLLSETRSPGAGGGEQPRSGCSAAPGQRGAATAPERCGEDPRNRWVKIGGVPPRALPASLRSQKESQSSAVPPGREQLFRSPWKGL